MVTLKFFVCTKIETTRLRTMCSSSCVDRSFLNRTACFDQSNDAHGTLMYGMQYRAQFEDLFVGPFAEAKKFCEDKEAYLKQV